MTRTIFQPFPTYLPKAAPIIPANRPDLEYRARYVTMLGFVAGMTLNLTPDYDDDGAALNNDAIAIDAGISKVFGESRTGDDIQNLMRAKIERALVIRDWQRYMAAQVAIGYDPAGAARPLPTQPIVSPHLASLVVDAAAHKLDSLR